MTGTGKAIRWSTAAAVIGVAVVAAVVSFEHPATAGTTEGPSRRLADTCMGNVVLLATRFQSGLAGWQDVA